MSADRFSAFYERRAAAIQSARRAAADLNAASEKLREQVDALDAGLQEAAQSGAIDQECFANLHAHVERVRRLRNAMECLHAEIQIQEAMDVAWKALP